MPNEYQGLFFGREVDDILRQSICYAGKVQISIAMDNAGEFYFDIPVASVPTAPTGWTLLAPILTSSTFRVLPIGVANNRVYYAVKTPTTGNTTITAHYLMRRT